MSEARMARQEDFDRHLMSIPGGEGMCGTAGIADPHQTGGDGGPHMDAVAGQFTRETLKEGLRLMSTPPDKPNPLFELWQQSIEAKEQEPFKGILKDVKGLVAVGGYELIPTEYESKEQLTIPMNRKPGDIVILPNRFTCQFDIDLSGVKDTIVTALTPFVGEKITEAMLKEVTAKTVAALNESLGKGLNATAAVPYRLPALGEIGYDWKKEQKLIAEEAKYQAELQQKIQDEMDQARMVSEGGPDTTQYVKRDGFIQEFFAYETVGATIPHTGTVVKTDDPELMKALGDAIEQGRVVMDGDTVVSIDGVPTDSKSTFEECDAPVVVTEKK